MHDEMKAMDKKELQKKFFLTNSLTKKREHFKPIHPQKVLFYSCGPTVYGALHIGNARALLFADIMFRWLQYIGYEVHFVRNYTDVDDKIIKRAIDEKKTSAEVSEYWTQYCEKDIELLGLKHPTETVKVTDSIPAIVQLIDRILENKHAYVVDGEVFFSIDSFQSYGQLSGKKVEDLQAGSRVEVDSKKQNPADFTLWKPRKKEVAAEPYWDPKKYGAKHFTQEGRPGWHIECSAMILKHLGESIDLHHGGQDLIFPHHENEIAQSEAATHKPFCSHWVHHAFLTSGNEKMSKSLGNILTIREFVEKKYSAEILKFLYLSFHYRTAVPYTEETLTQVLGELERIYKAKVWAETTQKATSARKNSKAWDEISIETDKAFEKIENEMSSDLNTSGAMGHLFTLIRSINRVEAQESEISESKIQAATKFLELLEKKLFPLWNVFGLDPETAFTQIDRVKRERAVAGNGELPSDSEILQLIEERKQARASKNFARADEIRKSLDARGIELVDSPQGTSWKVK